MLREALCVKKLRWVIQRQVTIRFIEVRLAYKRALVREVVTTFILEYLLRGLKLARVAKGVTLISARSGRDTFSPFVPFSLLALFFLAFSSPSRLVPQRPLDVLDSRRRDIEMIIDECDLGGLLTGETEHRRGELGTITPDRR
jgi:hypothetical protein